MRMVIISGDNSVNIDDFLTYDVDLSALDPDIHAVQWYDVRGHIEYIVKVDNEEIDSVDQFQDIIDQHAAIKYAYENPTYTDDEIISRNVESATYEQSVSLSKINENKLKIEGDLPATLTADDVLTLENFIQAIQNDIDRPTADPEYVPPASPEIEKPTYSSLTAEVTREPGWQGTLGYRFVLGGYDDGFVPGNLAMAVYSNPECDGYLYTTGAFVWDDVEQEWYAVCPAGQEPGDAAINFGMLNGATPISCFTLDQGVMQKIFNVYV